jgi:hypothetical protein
VTLRAGAPGSTSGGIPASDSKALKVPNWKSSTRVFTGTVGLSVLYQPILVLTLMAAGTGGLSRWRR